MHSGFRYRAARWALTIGGTLSVAIGARAGEPPVVPGYNRLKDQSKAAPAELGQVLLGELNCTQLSLGSGRQAHPDQGRARPE